MPIERLGITRTELRFEEFRPTAGLVVTLLALALSGIGCTGSGGGGAGGNDNSVQNANDNASGNVNDNAVENENDNASANENANAAENQNENVAENQNDNVPANENDNAAADQNDNVADNVNVNDNTGTAQGLAPEGQRAAFQSQCAQNVITCTVSFPVAVIGTGFLPGQVVTTTPAGLRIDGQDGDGVELVQLVGSGSTAGQGATQIFYSWSAGAIDPDPCTLTAGAEFSTQADPQVLLQAGFHYIRLTVRNDLPPIDSLDAGACGTFTNYPRQDFEEFEIEVVD